MFDHKAQKALEAAAELKAAFNNQEKIVNSIGDALGKLTADIAQNSATQTQINDIRFRDCSQLQQQLNGVSARVEHLYAQTVQNLEQFKVMNVRMQLTQVAMDRLCHSKGRDAMLDIPQVAQLAESLAGFVLNGSVPPVPAVPRTGPQLVPFPSPSNDRTPPEPQPA